MGIHQPLRPAVFLDRDGVLIRATVRNGKPHPPESVDLMEILPDVPEALARLRQAGFHLIVVTNQPDVARGRETREGVEAMHARLSAALPIDDVRVCYHDDVDACACRKPEPGMLIDAARDHGIDLSRSFMVGDRWRDVEAGRRAGCRTVFLDYGYAEPQPESPDRVVATLSEGVDWILPADR